VSVVVVFGVGVDIGDFDEVEVIEVLVNAGDELSAEDSIITINA
jgi:pyruvate/2-oxoglutarate dehydrogenase complex dihydrolipoamide acyltransferase (E2) component